MTRGRAALAALSFALLVVAWAATAANGTNGSNPSPKHAGEVVAKHRSDDDGGGWLDALGVSSLKDVPWAAFPVGLALSALIGTVGGIIYVGLVED